MSVATKIEKRKTKGQAQSSDKPCGRTGKPGASRERSSLLWELVGFTGSARLAVLLLILLIAFSVVGTLFPQGQPEEFYRMKYGGYSNLFLSLGLHHVYSTRWFLLLLTLVAVNLVASSARRYKRIRSQYANLKIDIDPVAFEKSPRVRLYPCRMSMGEATSRVEEALRRLRYGLRLSTPGKDEVFLYAERGRLRRWGSFYSHLGILIIFIGAIVGNIPGVGFRNDIELMEGTSYTIPGTDLSLELTDFHMKTDRMGRPLDFASDVKLHQGMEVIRKTTIRVNHPLEVKGYKFYQSSYGLGGLKVKHRAPDGMEEVIAFRLPNGELKLNMEESIKTLKNGWTLFSHNYMPHFARVGKEIMNLSDRPENPALQLFVNEDFKKDSTRWVPMGWMAAGESRAYKDHTFGFDGPIEYSGLQVRKDPGIPLVWTGFAVMMFGLCLAFYINESILRVYLRNRDGACQMFLLPEGDEQDFSREIEALDRAVRSS